jgi:hypothetical protein
MAGGRPPVATPRHISAAATGSHSRGTTYLKARAFPRAHKRERRHTCQAQRRCAERRAGVRNRARA